MRTKKHTFSWRKNNLRKRKKTDEKRILCKFTLSNQQEHCTKNLLKYLFCKTYCKTNIKRALPLEAKYDEANKVQIRNDMQEILLV